MTDEKDTKKRANSEVNSTDLNRIIQHELKVVDVIREMIFENTHGNFDPYMAKLTTYNLLKSIVRKCVNKEDTVETELLRALIQQVRLRRDMIVGVG